MILCQGLSVSLGRSVVLRGLTLKWAPGRVIALAGPNGAGKSMLLKFLAGVLDDRRCRVEGRALVFSESLQELSQAERARRIKYLGADLYSEFPLRVLDVLELHSRGGRGAVTEEVLEECQILELKNRTVDTLSGGERQRVALAAALVQQPDYFFFDEAFSKLDLHHQALAGRMMRRVATQGKGVVVVAHDLSFALSWSDEVMFMLDGQSVAQGEVSEPFLTLHLNRLYPGASIEVKKSGETGAIQILPGRS